MLEKDEAKKPEDVETRFGFTTHVIENVTDCNQMIREYLVPEKILGLDCEWFSKGSKKISLIQISTWDKVFLFRINLMKNTISEELEDIIKDEKKIKLGVDIENDQKKLKSDYGVTAVGLVDLRKFLKDSTKYLKITYDKIKCFEKKLQHERHISGSQEGVHRRSAWKPKSGLGTLVKEIFDFEMDKTSNVRAGDWEKPKLSDDQVKYAACDALFSIRTAFCLILDNFELTKDDMSEANIEKVMKACQKYVGQTYCNNKDFKEVLKKLRNYLEKPQKDEDEKPNNNNEQPEKGRNPDHGIPFRDYIGGKKSKILRNTLLRRLEIEDILYHESANKNNDGEMACETDIQVTREPQHEQM